MPAGSEIVEFCDDEKCKTTCTDLVSGQKQTVQSRFGETNIIQCPPDAPKNSTK